jgi:pilus assembly protein Flp/PilA
MIYLYAKLQTLMADRDRGATAVEYGLMIALIAAIIVVGVGALGTRVAAIFDEVVDAITP